MYELFLKESEGKTKNAAIDTLFGYPNDNKTLRYRVLIKHKDQDLWVGIVGKKLIEKCSNLSDQECFQYYDRNNLKDRNFLRSNNWFETDIV